MYHLTNTREVTWWRLQPDLLLKLSFRWFLLSLPVQAISTLFMYLAMVSIFLTGTCIAESCYSVCHRVKTYNTPKQIHVTPTCTYFCLLTLPQQLQQQKLARTVSSYAAPWWVVTQCTVACWAVTQCTHHDPKGDLPLQETSKRSWLSNVN